MVKKTSLTFESLIQQAWQTSQENAEQTGESTITRIVKGKKIIIEQYFPIVYYAVQGGSNF